jgi:hypothetical protein
LKPKEVYVKIQLLKKHGLSLRQIAGGVGCAVNTVQPMSALDNCCSAVLRALKLPDLVSLTLAHPIVSCVCAQYVINRELTANNPKHSMRAWR